MTKLTRDELIPRLARIRLLSLDVDGVLTDGGLYYTDSGEELRKFNVKDGMGIKRARAAGVEVCIISASSTPSIVHRGKRLGVPHVFVSVEDKLQTLTGLCGELGIDLAEVAHIGDDINDLPVLGKVGLPMTVADAVEAVRDEVRFVTERRGGEGAVREICDLLVRARGV
ncbi:MAG: HAD hydrolase family protein [Rhodospirillales bacterium]|nr:HAD hydrolase family protein [Rhodospirillales bacterium]MCW8951945.1 HAD hydrolase family protein [Rhodospirillales bacterium]MCW8970724.1 HAD hydrolase family protein [Rhodospirillales bacterium]MCW9039654.1 HAD hydrolase family protein [Rhodospirillales bacterium]